MQPHHTPGSSVLAPPPSPPPASLHNYPFNPRLPLEIISIVQHYANVFAAVQSELDAVLTRNPRALEEMKRPKWKVKEEIRKKASDFDTPFVQSTVAATDFYAPNEPKDVSFVYAARSEDTGNGIPSFAYSAYYLDMSSIDGIVTAARMSVAAAAIDAAGANSDPQERQSSYADDYEYTMYDN